MFQRWAARDTSLNNLAALYRAQGRYGEAEPLYKRSLAIREKALGPEHPQTGTRLNNLARLLEAKGEENAKELQCIKTTLLASMQGYAPMTAIEFGRKVLFSTERPTFNELEAHVKKK